MKNIISLILVGLFFVLPLSQPVLAVQPDEVLENPALEARARGLSKGLRCLVCRNESIDESNAPLARDLRLVVRERLVAGDSDTQVIKFIVDRYGEYVLLKPTATGGNWILWAAGPVMLLLAGLVGLKFVAGRSTADPIDEAALSDVEKTQLAKILNDDGARPDVT
jgi:cytochrome c-type biogenesis protein CcmH